MVLLKFSYQGDGLFDRDFGQQVNQFGVVQNIPNPGVVKAQNRLQNELTIQSTYAKQITENELKWKVRQLYADIQYQKELNKLYTRLTSTYAEYHRMSQIRVDVGEANPIESLTLKSKWQEYDLLQRQSDIVIANLEKQFQILLNSEMLVTTIDSMTTAPYLKLSDSLDNPLLLQSKQAMAVENAQIEIMRSELKPSFQCGVCNPEIL